MRLLTAFVLVLTTAASSHAAQTIRENSTVPTYDPSSVASISPALESYIHNAVNEDLWKRPHLSPRDRSVITLAVIISRNQTSMLVGELNRALDNGVEPCEISEIITHLAFYSGLANATSATVIMSHIAVTDICDSKNADWFEPVSDQQYKTQ
ncbi:carboxymuconolactone decarboxylase family protein [Dickeya chrysanthemi]|uniref:carboxymuconolactone decarboxylase family protein n=1 Tax=Dickeya chrysanthemi TaxID=556 RepID=UPI00301AE0A6